jgi:hypothetical protein
MQSTRRRARVHNFGDMASKRYAMCVLFDKSFVYLITHEFLQDIQGLLKEWEEDIADCERVWIRASWSNRRMFMDENGGMFEKGVPPYIADK